MPLQGSCHCGKIAFEVDAVIDDVMSCNCSMCQRKGSLLTFVPQQQFTLATPRENLSTYTFNTHKIQHHFCTTCGVAPFGEGMDPSSGAKIAAVNVRCIEDIDLGGLKVTEFDGRSL